MNIRAIINIVSILLLFIGISMLSALGVSWLCGDNSHIIHAWISCVSGTLILGCLGYWNTYRKSGESPFRTGARDGFAVVAFGWILSIFICALPFYFAGHFTMVDAIFESTSGLTTTGASMVYQGMVLRGGHRALTNGVEGLARGLVYWRSLLNWLGGIGIIVFVLLILPLMHIGQGKMLYNAEVPGMKTGGDQLTPRLSTSVKWLTGIYIALTLITIGVYYLSDLPLFDAVCFAFSTVSTGGFCSKNASAAAFPSPLFHVSMTVVMFLAACNFSLFIRSITKGDFKWFRDEEFRWFFCVVLLSALSVAGLLWFFRTTGTLASFPCNEDNFLNYLRVAFFQIITVISTTGFAISDCEAWQLPSVVLLIGLLMIPCGCGGSTAGGMKWARVIVVIKQIRHEVHHCLFARTVPDIRLNKERLQMDTVGKTMAFVLLYLGIAVVVMLFVGFIENCDCRTAYSATLSCLSNVGLALGRVGINGSFGTLKDATKILLSLTMLIGRLELYTVIVIFLPSFWKK